VAEAEVVVGLRLGGEVAQPLAMPRAVWLTCTQSRQWLRTLK